MLVTVFLAPALAPAQALAPPPAKKAGYETLLVIPMLQHVSIKHGKVVEARTLFYGILADNLSNLADTNHHTRMDIHNIVLPDRFTHILELLSYASLTQPVVQYAEQFFDGQHGQHVV